MSDPQPSRPEFPIVPALVVSSLLGGLIAFGLFSLWRFAFSEPLNPPSAATPPSVLMSPSGPTEFVEFLPPLTPQEKRIEEALEKMAECEFTDTPLLDVVQYLEEYASIKIVIDTQALTDEGIATDTPVTRKLANLRLRSMLLLMFRPLQLTAIPKHDVLLVITQSRSREHRVTRAYPVSDLCYLPGYQVLDFQSLIRVIEEETPGPWMNRDGEGGTITESESTGSIIVRETYQGHREILE